MAFIEGTPQTAEQIRDGYRKPQPMTQSEIDTGPFAGLDLSGFDVRRMGTKWRVDWICADGVPMHIYVDVTVALPSGIKQCRDAIQSEIERRKAKSLVAPPTVPPVKFWHAITIEGTRYEFGAETMAELVAMVEAKAGVGYFKDKGPLKQAMREAMPRVSSDTRVYAAVEAECSPLVDMAAIDAAHQATAICDGCDFAGPPDELVPVADAYRVRNLCPTCRAKSPE